MAKQLIYQVFKKYNDWNDNDHTLEYAKIYQDGAFEITWDRNKHKLFMSWWTFPSDWSEEIKEEYSERFERYWEESVKSDQWTTDHLKTTLNVALANVNGITAYWGQDDDGCPLINERYQDAYDALCVITNNDAIFGPDAPPYDDSDFTVEYFGEGEPWERDPYWTPGTVY